LVAAAHWNIWLAVLALAEPRFTIRFAARSKVSPKVLGSVLSTSRISLSQVHSQISVIW